MYHVYAHMRVSMRAFVYHVRVYVNVRLLVRVGWLSCACGHADKHVCVCLSVHVYKCVHVCTYVCFRTCICVHVRIDIIPY